MARKNGIVVNRRHYAYGRKLAQWGITGMNWGSPTRERVSAVARGVLRDPKACAKLGAWGGNEMKSGCVAQTNTTAAIYAAAGYTPALVEFVKKWEARKGE